MNTIVYKIDKTYGGYDYVEYNPEKNIYKTGNTRAHAGHWDFRYLEVEVATLRELKNFETQLETFNVERVDE